MDLEVDAAAEGLVDVLLEVGGEDDDALEVLISCNNMLVAMFE